MILQSNDQHSKVVSFEGFTINATSQFMKNSERIKLFEPTGKQLPVRQQDGTFGLISEGVNKNNRKELQLVYQKNGSSGSVSQEPLRMYPFDSLIGMKAIPDKDGVEIVYTIVKRDDQINMEWGSLNDMRFMATTPIDFEFDYWDITKNGNDNIVVLFGSKKDQPFLLDLKTKIITKLPYIDVSSEKVKKVVLSNVKVKDGGSNMMSVILTESEGQEGPESQIYFSVYNKNNSRYMGGEQYDSDLGLNLIQDIFSSEIDGTFYTFLITNDGDDNGSVVHRLNVLNDQGNHLNASTSKAISLSGSIENISLGFIDYHENNLPEDYNKELPSLFIEASYLEDKIADNGKIKYLLKCDPYLNKTYPWELGTYVPDIENASIHYNYLEKDTEIFCTRKSKVSLPQLSTPNQDIIEYLTVDKDTSLFSTQHLQIEAVDETEEVLIHATCSYFHFEPENETIKFPLDENQLPYIGISSTSKCSIMVDGNYYQLKPGTFQKVNILSGRTLAIISKSKTIDSPILLFNLTDSDKVLRYKTSYLADEKIKNTKDNSGDKYLLKLKEANKATAKFDAAEAFCIINKDSVDAHSMAAYFQKQNPPDSPSDFFFAIDFKGESPTVFYDADSFDEFNQQKIKKLEFGIPAIIDDIVDDTKKVIGDITHTMSHSTEWVEAVAVKWVDNVCNIAVTIAGKTISGVINTFESAWNFIANLATEIWKTLEEVITFLGYLLNLEDVLEMKENLKDSVNQSIETVEKILGKDSILRNDIKALASSVEAVLKSLKPNDISTKGVQEKKSNQQGSINVNPKLAYVKDNKSRNHNEKLPKLSFSSNITDELQTIISHLTDTLRTDFESIFSFVKNDCHSFDDLLILFQKVGSLFIDLSIQTVEIIEEILEKFLDLIVDGIDDFKKFLNADLTSIPFMGPILHSFIKGSFSLLDILAFAIAIPVVSVSKLIKEITPISVTEPHSNDKIELRTPSDYKHIDFYVRIMRDTYTVYKKFPRETALAISLIGTTYSEFSYLKNMSKPVKVGISLGGVFFKSLGIGSSISSLIHAFDQKNDFKIDMSLISLSSNFEGLIYSLMKDRKATSKDPLVGPWMMAGVLKTILPIYLITQRRKEEGIPHIILKSIAVINNSVAYPYRNIVLMRCPIVEPIELVVHIAASGLLRGVEFDGRIFGYAMKLD